MIENAACDDKIEACLCVFQETFKISKQKARLIEIKKLFNNETFWVTNRICPGRSNGGWKLLCGLTTLVRNNMARQA